MLKMVLLGPRRARPPICIVKPMVPGGYFQMQKRKKEGNHRFSGNLVNFTGNRETS